MAKNTANYGNDSIRQLKDEERVRLRPAVIFGSDGLDGCAHAAFEILSNAVDEARQGYGKLITLIAFRDGSIQVEDNGRGCPLDWNPSEKRFNWELVFCELYAGGKYNNNQGGDYDFSLGTNGLGSCATQYASEYRRPVSSRRRYAASGRPAPRGCPPCCGREWRRPVRRSPRSCCRAASRRSACGPTPK